MPAFDTRCETNGSGFSVSLSATTIARPSASNPSLIPPGSRANTDAIGSPASTLSPGFTVITKPTVGSTWSSTLRRPPPIATTARPTTFGSTWTTTPVRGALYLDLLGLRQHRRILHHAGIAALRLDHALEFLGR